MIDDNDNDNDDDRNVWSASGHITVQRGLGVAPFVEVWVFQNLLWAEGNTDYDLVKCYICRADDPDTTGVPRKAPDTLKTQMEYEEVPEEVKREFRAQVGRINEATGRLLSGEQSGFNNDD